MVEELREYDIIKDAHLITWTGEDNRAENPELETVLMGFKRKKWYDRVSDVDLEALLEFYKKPYRKKGMPEPDFKGYRARLESRKEFYSEFFGGIGGIYCDTRYSMHLCCKSGRKYMGLATIGFDACREAVEVKQVQGVKDRAGSNFVRDHLSQVYWTYALLTLVTDWSIQHGVPEVRVRPKNKSEWGKVTRNPRYYRQYDLTAVDLGFRSVSKGKVIDVEFSEKGRPDKYVSYYSLKLDKGDNLCLHPGLLDIGITCPDFDIREIYRR